MQWRPWTAFGDDAIASTICHCLNFQQGPKRDDSPRPKLISPNDVTGKMEFDVTDVCCDYVTENLFFIYFQEMIHLLCLLKHLYS